MKLPRRDDRGGGSAVLDGLMGYQMEIRRAKISDAKTLRDAEASTAETPGLLVSRPDELEVAAFERTIRELDASGLYLVAELDGEIVGHAFLEPMKLAAVAHVFHLTMVIHPGYRGRGIGRRLLEELLRRAEDVQQVEKVELRVRATNEAAIRLYECAGFSEEGRFRHRVKLPDGTLVDDIGMAWFPSVRG